MRCALLIPTRSAMHWRYVRQRRAIVPHGLATALPPQGGRYARKEAKMIIEDRHAALEPADATTISYSLLRHLGFMLDELSAQGLRIWQDQGQRWCWAWADTALQSERGFWSIGEAIV